MSIDRVLFSQQYEVSLNERAKSSFLVGRHGEELDPCAGWTWNRHGHYDSHIPEVFPYITFSDRLAGS